MKPTELVLKIEEAVAQGLVTQKLPGEIAGHVMSILVENNIVELVTPEDVQDMYAGDDEGVATSDIGEGSLSQDNS